MARFSKPSFIQVMIALSVSACTIALVVVAKRPPGSSVYTIDEYNAAQHTCESSGFKLKVRTNTWNQVIGVSCIMPDGNIVSLPRSQKE